jgi:hypothetical protein
MSLYAMMGGGGAVHIVCEAAGCRSRQMGSTRMRQAVELRPNGPGGFHRKSPHYRKF